MANLDTFTLYPLQINHLTKTIQCTELIGYSTSAYAISTELHALNQLYRTIVGLDDGGTLVPPPPIPVNPKRTANVNKLRDSGNGEFRKGRYIEAIKFYSLGLQMALTRPSWEPSQLVNEEVATLYANRAQAHMAMQGWAEGAIDAEASVEAKKMGNAKAWWRRGKCLLEMGRLEEAKEWVRHGLEMEGEEHDLLALRVEIQSSLSKVGDAF